MRLNIPQEGRRRTESSPPRQGTKPVPPAVLVSQHAATPRHATPHPSRFRGVAYFFLSPLVSLYFSFLLPPAEDTEQQSPSWLFHGCREGTDTSTATHKKTLGGRSHQLPSPTTITPPPLPPTNPTNAPTMDRQGCPYIPRAADKIFRASKGGLKKVSFRPPPARHPTPRSHLILPTKRRARERSSPKRHRPTDRPTDLPLRHQSYSNPCPFFLHLAALGIFHRALAMYPSVGGRSRDGGHRSRSRSWSGSVGGGGGVGGGGAVGGNWGRCWGWGWSGGGGCRRGCRGRCLGGCRGGCRAVSSRSRSSGRGRGLRRRARGNSLLAVSKTAGIKACKKNEGAG